MIHDDTPANLGESEPPHVKNWFSSYEYESFVLETNDNFGFSDDPESQGYENERSSKLVTNGENEGMLIKCNQLKEDNKCEKQVLESPESPVLSSEPPGVENWFSSYTYESPEVDTIDELILSDKKESMVDCNEQAKEYETDENLCVIPDDLISKQTSECDNDSAKDDKNPTGIPNIGADVTSCESGSRKLEEAGNGFVSIKSKKENYEKSKQVNGADQNNGADVTSCENGSRKLEEAGNGFVSIKSKKEKYEKLKQVNGADQKRCVVSSVNKMKKRSNERVTLGDVTNIFEEHSTVTGKWKCPNKRKPDIGPPLKQLRLGQWFHQL